MPITILERLKNLYNDDDLVQFINRTDLLSDKTINKMMVASNIKLARTISNESERIAGSLGKLEASLGASTTFLAKKLSKQSEKITDSLDKLGVALEDSATAANKHANSLKYATWTLVIATGFLAVATFVLAAVAVIGERA